ncbi:hypothetical protein M3A78_005880 [Micrococcus luteus]|uniref:hypothetical protein n=2 Tax=Micrococcus luteus TaxID=1270 RepID=UPI0006651C31|nr:hypothetical protein [Micrococcus luteus]MCV7717822.1 hypothetical protein [Micrococcus luteus]MCV7720023.1 hypothetical protein [Micrococcus luteus]MCV7734475.1 hypothetical protein [Micrococcus luteus]
MASPWVEDDELTDWEGPAAADDDGQVGTPLPYVAPEVAAELAGEGPPVWMGTRWREIEAEHQWEAWNTLRRWVDWFVAEYRLVTSVVPPCWYKHSDLTAELYAAMCMEYKVWEEQAPGLGPMMMWHPHVEMLTARLRRMVDEAGCAKTGAHKEPEAYGDRPAFTLDYDEDDFTAWASTTREEDTLERPPKGVQYVRARVVDADGGEVAVSNPVGLTARKRPTVAAVSVELVSSTPTDPRVWVSVSSAAPGFEAEWQTSVDGKRWG